MHDIAVNTRDARYHSHDDAAATRGRLLPLFKPATSNFAKARAREMQQADRASRVYNDATPFT